MRHSVVVSLAALALAVGSLGGKCAAQNVPSGTYQQSCKDIRVNGDTLQARCEDNSRHWRTTELGDFWRCSGDITNVNGTLTCDRSQSNSWQTGGPAGSYQQSCRDVRRRGNRLEARCEDGNRNWNWTYLDNADRCTSDIANVNGRLQCEMRASSVGSMPAGSYSQSCREIRMRYNRLEAQCQDGSGNWNSTSLENPGQCTTDIVNENGQLRCETRRTNEGTVPAGSYSQSCREIRMRYNRLEAQCRDGNGNWNSTSLENPGQCTSDIVNENGQLRCERRGRQGRSYNWQGSAPQGSYTQSCRNITLEGDTLRAECPNPGGHFKASSLSQVSTCVGDITNRNGKLWCSRQ